MTPAVRNEAMYAFTLRASADPTPARTAGADVETIKADGGRNRIEQVATDFGDRLDTAVARMRRAVSSVARPHV